MKESGRLGAIILILVALAVGQLARSPSLKVTALAIIFLSLLILLIDIETVRKFAGVALLILTVDLVLGVIGEYRGVLVSPLACLGLGLIQLSRQTPPMVRRLLLTGMLISIAGLSLVAMRAPHLGVLGSLLTPCVILTVLLILLAPTLLALSIRRVLILVPLLSAVALVVSAIATDVPSIVGAIHGLVGGVLVAWSLRRRSRVRVTIVY